MCWVLAVVGMAPVAKQRNFDRPVGNVLLHGTQQKELNSLINQLQSSDSLKQVMEELLQLEADSSEDITSCKRPRCPRGVTMFSVRCSPQFTRATDGRSSSCSPFRMEHKSSVVDTAHMYVNDNVYILLRLNMLTIS